MDSQSEAVSYLIYVCYKTVLVIVYLSMLQALHAIGYVITLN